MLKKILVLFVILICVVASLNLDSSVEAKKSKKGGIPEADMTAMSATVDTLTKKMYGKGLFSPEDNENLIDIKIKLDNQMLIASDPTLAPLYYRIAILLKSRDMKDESIECFQTVLENFADTALAPKAAAQLKSMGVEVKAPEKKDAGGDSGE